MLIWLASYPRSGNTYVRSVLKGVFGLETYSLNGDGDERVFSTRPGMLSIVGHRRSHFIGDELVKAAHHSDELFIIKTHEPPLTDDPTIFIVRDGRSAVVSYFHYCNDVEALYKTLDDVIIGNVYAGSWSDHFESWSPITRKNTLLLRYEDITQNARHLIERLAKFCNLRQGASVVPSFQDLHKIFPSFFRGGDDGKNIAEIGTSLPLFMERHGWLMRQLGYCPTLYS